jgi:hypothetical protein
VRIAYATFPPPPPRHSPGAPLGDPLADHTAEPVSAHCEGEFMRDGRTRHPVELCVGVGVPERVWLADCVIDWVIEGVSDGLMLCDRL